MNSYQIGAEALLDLGEVWDHIAKIDTDAADRWLEATVRRFELLADYPQTGQRRPDLAEGLWFISFEGYHIFYQPMESGLRIVRVIHSSLG